MAFAPGALRVTEVHVALGQDPPGPSQETGSEPKQAEEEKAEKGKEAEKEKAGNEPAHKRKPARKDTPSKANAPTSSSPKSSDGEKHEKEESPAAGGAGELVLSATSTAQLVTVKVKAEQQQLARVGEHAPVTLPGGRIVTGRVTGVGTVASTPSSNEKGGGGESESPTITVTLALSRPVTHLDQAPVSVELVKSIRRHVLTVPAAALSATAGGGYALSALEGGHRVAVPVTPGMFAGGYVEVEGAGVHSGLKVLEAR